MALKTIIAVASGTKEDERLFAVSAKLGAQFGGGVVVLPAFPDAAADYVGYGVALAPGKRADAIARVRESEKELQGQVETAGRAAAEGEGLSWRGEGERSFEVRLRELRPIEALKTFAPLADLTIFGASAARDGFLLGDLFADALLGIRAPILLVKEGPFNCERVAIAWDGSFQAARAVRAALPLLKSASSVFVVTNSDDADAALVDLEPIMRFLKLHGVTNIASISVHGENIATSLLEAARAKQCGLLVAGGYGRPRLMEFALGGTTRALVNASEAPHLVLAH